MLNLMSVLIALNPIHRELHCWGYACPDSYRSLHRAQPPEQTESVPDKPGVKSCRHLHWVCGWSSALLKAKRMHGLTWILHLTVWEREHAPCVPCMSQGLTGRFLACSSEEREYFVVEQVSDNKKGKFVKPRRLLHCVGKSRFYNTSNHLKQGHSSS